MKIARKILKSIFIPLRRKQLRFEMYRVIYLNKSVRPKLFNLDLHISVISDLAADLRRLNVDLVNWSISGSNRHTRKIFRFPDPVAGINSNNWTRLSPILIDEFLHNYSRELRFFDGFVVTHTPSFAQIFENFAKPQLIVNSTRYEAPYTNNPVGWKNLNQSLRRQSDGNKLTIWSNNEGDREYLKYFTGLDSQLIPSLCKYINYSWPGTGKVKLVMARSEQLQNELSLFTNGLLVPFRKFLDFNYKWEDFDEVSEILVIPYNISTMSLFEFATAGIPVAIPGRQLMKQLFLMNVGVLSELSYYQVQNLDTTLLSLDNPNNLIADGIIDWWLDKADYYNLNLMPNVRIIESIDEIKMDFFECKGYSMESYRSRILSRNTNLDNLRVKNFKEFVEKL